MADSRSWRGLLFAAVAYFILTLWWIWPLPLHLATHSSSEPPNPIIDADYHLVVWALSWGAHALVRAPWDVFHANTFHPSTLSLAYSEHLLGQQPFFAPTYWLTGNPVLATNVLIVAVNVASATAMFALVRRFATVEGAFVAGVLFAFCPWRSHGFYHPHMLGVQYVPLVPLLAERWFARAWTRDAVLLGIALTLHMLSSVYLAFVMVVLLAIYLPLACWRWRARLDRRRLAGLGVVCAVAATVMALASLPYLHLMRLGLISSYTADGLPTPIGITAAPLMLARYLRSEGVGPVGYALALVALLPPWRRHRWPLALGTSLALAGVLLAAGPTPTLGRWTMPTPYGLLVETLPGFGTVRVVVRFAVLAQAGLALLAGLGVARLLARAPGIAGWPLAVAVSAAILWTWSPIGPRRLEARAVGATVPPVYRWLAEHGAGRVVLELPDGGFTTEARRMFLGTVHWLPTVNGYSGYPPRTASHLQQLAARLPDGAALQALVDLVDVGWIVVHTGELPSARDWEARLPDGLRLAARFPDALVLDVTRAGDATRRARLLSERETVDGVPRLSLGDRCPGRIELVGGVPPVTAGSTVRMELLLHNDGDRPWPAFGFVRPHLVELVACVRPAGDARCAGVPTPLPVDLHPGRSLRMDVSVKVPATAAAGAHAVHVELVQYGDGPLARCGVAPLDVPLRRVAR